MRAPFELFFRVALKVPSGSEGDVQRLCKLLLFFFSGLLFHVEGCCMSYAGFKGCEPGCVVICCDYSLSPRGYSVVCCGYGSTESIR